jgi:O-antigen biosynthesis protein WbqP
LYDVIKRIFDIVCSAVALILTGWLLILIAILIKVEDGGNVIFKQRRIGKHKKEFYIYKFRTMRADTPKDTPTHLLSNPNAYITKIGAFLRKSSLDELPQLLNILKGDMSIVGPRPALYNQYDLIAERDKYGANDVAVGLTGWAQINGRDELPINIKAKLDGEYVKKRSLFFDALVIVKTVGAVFRADGVKEGK